MLCFITGLMCECDGMRSGWNKQVAHFALETVIAEVFQIKGSEREKRVPVCGFLEYTSKLVYHLASISTNTNTIKNRGISSLCLQAHCCFLNDRSVSDREDMMKDDLLIFFCCESCTECQYYIIATKLVGMDNLYFVWHMTWRRRCQLCSSSNRHVLELTLTVTIAVQNRRLQLHNITV